MNLFISGAIILLFCVDYYVLYRQTVKRHPQLTEKQRAYILSIKASVTLFLISLYFNGKFFFSNRNLEDYLNTLSVKDQFLLTLSTYNLVSYLIMDCTIGFLNYHKYMCSLSGYIHHIVYIFISFIATKTSVLSYYFLYMIEELPTILLSTGSYNTSFRKNYSFGLIFFVTRILYHAYLTYTFRHQYLILGLGLASLGVHSYWFQNWFSKWIIAPLKERRKKKLKTN
jgi:hypothetical protein